jgi:hypothetical protein
VVLPTLTQVGSDAFVESETHHDPTLGEVLASPWALYQRLVHLFLGLGMLAYVPTVAAVFTALRCSSVVTSVVPAGSPLSAAMCTGASHATMLGMGALLLVVVVLGVPLLLAGVLLGSGARARFRDVFYWRRYGGLYVQFKDSR